MMTDTPAPAKTRKSARKGAPPTAEETLGALASSVESDAVASVPSADPSDRPKATNSARAKAASSKAPSATSVAPDAPKKARKPTSERTKPLNFRVTNEFRKAFKQAAAADDCKKVELLERIFDAWRAARSSGSQ